ncbi:hypothetical protein EGR_08806 [Echinococcus granulosus]|uniref:Uncharacterized protein n=1 Tax=Echinococcus granulosus TaxID=6210 RepID=W6U7J1_ECHGR|nr:hypothetical protein EGR_08806 [Echinococcus granulosus]EUB56331.1 hypothetical protein EGR_08806 [Echinococcus granulosus]
MFNEMKTSECCPLNESVILSLLHLSFLAEDDFHKYYLMFQNKLKLGLVTAIFSQVNLVHLSVAEEVEMLSNVVHTNCNGERLEERRISANPRMSYMSSCPMSKKREYCPLLMEISCFRNKYR